MPEGSATTGAAPNEPTRSDPALGAAEAPAGDAHVAVVIPAYRCAPTIVDVVRGIPSWVRTVVVVDDASPDDLSARVVGLGDARVTLVRHEQNRGVGGATRTGFETALERGADIVVKMDGDDQMDPAALPALLQPLSAGAADMTKGNRYHDLGALRAMPTLRIAGNAGLTFLVKLSSGYWNLFDPANGYVAIRSGALRRLDLAGLPDRFFFESGLLIEMGILRAVVVDVPIAARYSTEQSGLSETRALIEFPPQLLRGLCRRVFWHYFVHDFTALSVFVLIGLPMVLWGFGYGIRAYARMLATGTPATAGMVMISAMPILLGVQLLLQAVVLDVGNVPTRPLSGPAGTPNDARS